MTILVTGAAGFIGAAVSEALLRRGEQLVGIDNLNDYYDVELKNARLKRLSCHPEFKFVQLDISDRQDVSELFHNSAFDIVVNLAAQAGVRYSMENPSAYVDANLVGFGNILEGCRHGEITHLVYASSSSVYGVSDAPDVTEEHPLVPLTLYNKFKGMCEPLLKKYTDSAFTGVIFRPATVCGYGPRQRLDVSVNILTNHAINKGKITVFGGSQLRPNLHIQDYCDLCQLLLEAPAEKIQNEIFNCGVENMSIMEIAQTVKRVVEEEFPDINDLEIVTTPTDDIRSYHINSDKITRVLGFKPTHTVEDAIRDLCTAFRNSKLPSSFDDDIYFNVRRLKRINAG